jgi:hypothetical protein
MLPVRRLWTIALASSLVTPARGARPEALGIIVQANRASLGVHSVSQGSSVYDGEQLSTSDGGSLLLRSGAVLLHLAEESTAIVRASGNGKAREFGTELIKGTVQLSVAAGAAGEICARGACIRCGGVAPVMVRVSVLGPSELSVFARRGSVTLTYYDESETIAEGGSYRVVLDPPDEHTTADRNAKMPGKRSKAFLLIAIAVTIAITPPILLEQFESPDRP